MSNQPPLSSSSSAPSSGGFRGFADFASPDFVSSSGSTTAAATLAAARASSGRSGGRGGGRGGGGGRKGGTSGRGGGGGGGRVGVSAPSPPSLVRPSPIYSGSDPRLSVLFRKIGQKRDPVTKVRALEDLAAAVYPPPSPPASASGEEASGANGETTTTTTAAPSPSPSSFPRPEKIAALAHLAHLHAAKLGYDNVPSVRAASYAAMAAARHHAPRAWMALFLGDAAADPDRGGGGGSGTSAAAASPSSSSPVAGMAWAAARGDPASEVRACAGAFVDGLLLAGGVGGVGVGAEGEGSRRPGRALRDAALRHAKLVLGCKRPSALQDAIGPATPLASSSSGGNNGGGGGADADKRGKKSKSKSKSKSNMGASASSAASESEREEAEERYERVVLSALRGLGWLLERCHEGAGGDGDNVPPCYSDLSSFPDPASFVRLLQGSRASFRRGACDCVARACQFAPSTVLGAPWSYSSEALSAAKGPTSSSSSSNNALSLGELIPTLLASERDPSNFALMFEMILSYLAAFRKEGGQHQQQSLSSSPWEGMDPVAFAKSLCKALRRGCCGAPAAAWGPAILPIVASLPPRPPPDEEKEGAETKEREPLPLLVVSSLWDGRKSAAGVADAIATVSAAAECATFLMLRSPGDPSRVPTFTAQSWRSCGQLFLDALSYYLTEAQADVGRGPAAAAAEELCETLSRDLRKLDEASPSSDPNVSCNGKGITEVASWLWEGLERTVSLEGKEHGQKNIIRKWGGILGRLTKSSTADTSSSHMIPACKILFCSIVRTSAAAPSKDEGRSMLSILRFCGVNNVFPLVGDQTVASEPGGEEGTYASIERFCVNDLLRWILVHASSSASVKIDFEIFKLCIKSIPSSTRHKLIWETFLREMIKSGCDYTTLAIGVTTLAGEGDNGSAGDIVRCKVLDTFAIDTAEQAMGAFRRSHDILHHHEELDEESTPAERRGDLSLFLNTCVGLKGHPSGPLVSISVIRHWVLLCCGRNTGGKKLEESLIIEEESETNVLLGTLLDLAISPLNVISRDETVELVYESWLEGGRTWDERAVELFDTEVDSVTGATLKEKVDSLASSALRDAICSNPPDDHALLELICQAWAKRAARLIDSLGLAGVGLSSIELWDGAVLSEGGKETEYLFLCLMYLLHSIDDLGHRRDILFKDSRADLFVHIHTCLSKGNDPLLESFQTRTTCNRQLMETLGDSEEVTDAFLEDCITHNIQMLSSLLKDESSGNRKLIGQALTSLSFLVSRLFPSALFGQDSSDNNDGSDDVIPGDVKKGDVLWYERGEERTRVRATVVKIHTDDFPNLYYTIKEEGSTGERQTVAGRLKWNPTSDRAGGTLSRDEGDNALRERIGRRIVDNLVKPFLSEITFDDVTKIEVSAECINIIVSQCGLVSMGIGSVRYDVFQLVTTIEKGFCDALSTSETQFTKCAPLLRVLALAMGYGICTAPSQDIIVALKMDPSGSIEKLLDFYDDVSWVEVQRADLMKSFHSGVLMWLASAASGIKDEEIFGRVASMMQTLADLLLSQDSCDLALDSLRVMHATSSLQAACKGSMDYSSVLSKLTRCFVQPSFNDISGVWIKTFSTLLQQNYEQSLTILSSAVNSFSNDLCDSLFHPVKRWCAFQLLHICAQDSQPLNSEDFTFPSEIEQQLSLWKNTMDEEEAIELEEDTHVTALWLPQKLMSLLQNIGNDSDPDPAPEVQLVGKLLMWITCLDILDVAGSVDMRNRSHISSFIQKTNALGPIINLALEQADLDISRSENIFACVGLNGKDEFLVQKIATLAVFKTVESLPTLVKTWYNDDCPRFLRQKLSSFVETIVAPATLQRELVRIKDATSFGEMTVSGSCVSREVVAIYQQDECQLSVSIRMPSTFPLRNVEVDCQKTMGISESRWRRWALQIMLMLNNQDGSVLDALLLWKQNVDKEFEGVEPCPVCYSVLCIKTHQMPNLECKTCHNRFHTTCLYKWFQSSGKSQCVLCQQPWSGTRAS